MRAQLRSERALRVQLGFGKVRVQSGSQWKPLSRMWPPTEIRLLQRRLWNKRTLQLRIELRRVPLSAGIRRKSLHPVLR